MGEYILEVLKLIHSCNLILIHIKYHVYFYLVVMYFEKFVLLGVKFIILFNFCLILCLEHFVLTHCESFRFFSVDLEDLARVDILYGVFYLSFILLPVFFIVFVVIVHHFIICPSFLLHLLPLSLLYLRCDLNSLVHDQHLGYQVMELLLIMSWILLKMSYRIDKYTPHRLDVQLSLVNMIVDIVILNYLKHKILRKSIMF